jgi:hypothetical protein
MNNKELSKCKTGTTVAFKTNEGNWFTGKIQFIYPPNSEYNSNNFYKFSVYITSPVEIHCDSQIIYYYNEIIDIKLLENKTNDMETHKVIDATHENICMFTGTFQECMKWKSEHGYGYKIIPLTKDEIDVFNELDEKEVVNENHNNISDLLSDKNNNFNWEYFKKYVETYDINKHSIGDKCTFEDMLYGLGVALYGKKYRYANGYRLFEQDLKKWLENKNK